MFVRLKKHRQYSYTPRFYKPEEDESYRTRQRIRFRRGGTLTADYRKKSRSMLFKVIAVAAVIYLIYWFAQFAQ